MGARQASAGPLPDHRLLRPREEAALRIVYLSLSYVPSRRASSVHAMKMCQALARAGARVTLVTKRSRARQEQGVADDFGFYGVEPCFEVVKLRRPAMPGGGLVYSSAVRRLLARRRRSVDLVYARDAAGARAAADLGLPLVFEMHAPPSSHRERQIFARVLRADRMLRAIVITEALRRRLATANLLPADLDVLVAPDAADPPADRPAGSPPPGFRPGRRHYGYVGQLHPGKGIELLVPLAEATPEADFHVVGGSAARLEQLGRAGVPANLRLHGFVPPGELGGWYSSFDALLLPSQPRVYGASGITPIGDVMSPMKLFEYMAAGRPIVSSDLPVLREILRHEENALLAPPDDPAAWRRSLARLEAEPELGERLARVAREELVACYTWDRRAERVLRGLAR